MLKPDDEHNRRTLANLRPAGRSNPEPAGSYNLVVLGAGTAGLVSAIGSAGLGAKVALVETHLMGGDCLNYGCVPSKALLRCARAAAEARRGADYGLLLPGPVKVDFPAVMERMRRLRCEISVNDSVRRYTERGVDVFIGAGRFVGPRELEVDGKRLRFRKAVIATGARAALPPVPGVAEAGALTNETVFSLTRLPRRLAVVGAGPIGCELAQAFARFGAEVSLVMNSDRILAREEPEAARRVERALAADGIKLLARSALKRVFARAGEKILELERAGGALELAADEILIGVGRAPNVEGLGLEAAGVRFDVRAGICVDDSLRTTNPDIYAAGDCCFKHKFTHAADALARIVIQNALFPGPKKKASSLTIPWCTYTDPEIAHVGLYEHEARERGIPARSFVVELSEVDRAVLDGESGGFVKLLVEEGGDAILGATIVAAHAGEMLGELTLAVTAGIGLGTLAKTIHPYPTQSEGVKRAADAYMRTRLTPLVRSLLERWLAWQR